MLMVALIFVCIQNFIARFHSLPPLLILLLSLAGISLCILFSISDGNFCTFRMSFIKIDAAAPKELTFYQLFKANLVCMY